MNRDNFDTAQRHHDQQEHPDYWRQEPPKCVKSPDGEHAPESISCSEDNAHYWTCAYCGTMTNKPQCPNSPYCRYPESEQ